jgi:uncharacterized membrane protein YeaQ/YmgE (transglycosylase-associated protein family)
MSQLRTTQRILLTLMLGSSCAMEAYGRSPTTRQETETMSFLAWIALGLVAGFIGSKIVNRRGEGIFLDVLLGIVGAITGGWLFRIFGARGVSGLNLYSLMVAVIGSVVFLVAYHAVRPRRAF